MLRDNLRMVTRLGIDSTSPDNNRLHTEHSAGVLPEIACLSCPVNLERYPTEMIGAQNHGQQA